MSGLQECKENGMENMFSNARVQRVIDDLSDHTYRDYFMENARVRFLFTSCVVSENERVSAAQIEYISNFIENQKPNLQFLFTTNEDSNSNFH